MVHELRELDQSVGCVVRDSSRIAFDSSVVVHRADLRNPGSLEAIGGDYASALYLVHSMGHGGNANYEEHDVAAASNFARIAVTAGIGRVTYLEDSGISPAVLTLGDCGNVPSFIAQTR